MTTPILCCICFAAGTVFGIGIICALTLAKHEDEMMLRAERRNKK